VTGADGGPPPPWTCRLRAVLAFARAGARPAGFAVAHYLETPVGPYREALVGVVTGPRSGRVPWMVVDSAPSMAAGRAWWGLPKELADLRADAALGEAEVDGGGAAVAVRARPRGPAVPVALAVRLRQPGLPPARAHLRGRARPATVVLTGRPPHGLRPGSRPGAVLEGTLHLSAPGG
jgi:hypothetical protein